MEYGFCDLATVPVRVQPGDRNEMSNQLLFGDTVKIKDKVNGWLLTESSHDGYEGWVDEKQLRLIDGETFERIEKSPSVFVLDGCGTAGRFSLTRGARLPQFRENSFQVQGEKFDFTGKTFTPGKTPDAKTVETLARLYLGAPYLWGGRSPWGLDCSGFVQIVFRMAGIQLDRDASQQVMQGETINLLHEARKGDLAFFENTEGSITHTGILLDNNSIIHASGQVRIDTIDHQGIFNAENQHYTHRLRTIKRLL